VPVAPGGLPFELPLGVADASVMPDIPSANTNLPTIMVAERIAGWLHEDL
jgi:choline dehydrogenase-like flavoprotein